MSPEYKQFVEEKLQPFLNDTVQEGYCTSSDGIKLHYHKAIHPNESATIVMIHGFSEFFGKHHENAYRFYNAGYSIFFLELRGHGKSERTDSHKDSRVHVSDFQEYVEDVHSFMEQVVEKESKTHTYFLFAHSMGGAVSTLYLEQYPDTFKCAVLSSPMLMMNYGKVPDLAVDALAAYSKVAPVDEEFGPSQKPFDGIPDFEHSSMLDKDRYEYQFSLRTNEPLYQTWGGTWGWIRAGKEATNTIMKNINKVKTPVLLLQAEKDTMVRLGGQNVFDYKNPKVTLLEYKDSKHEIFNATKEIREQYYKDILDYFKAYTTKKS